MGSKRMKAQESLPVELNRSQKTVAKLATEVHRANNLYERSAARFEEAADRMEDMKLMSMLPKGSDEYKIVMAEYMEKGENVKKRKVAESLAAQGPRPHPPHPPITRFFMTHTVVWSDLHGRSSQHYGRGTDLFYH